MCLIIRYTLHQLIYKAPYLKPFTKVAPHDKVFIIQCKTNIDYMQNSLYFCCPLSLQHCHIVDICLFKKTDLNSTLSHKFSLCIMIVQCY